MKKQKKKSNFIYDFIRITGFLPCWIWLRPKIIRENKNVPKRIKGGVLIASNHVTYVDPIILHCAFIYRRLYSIATKDICKTKLRRFLFTTANCIIIDKEKFALESLRTICDMLKQEKAVVIFPESSINSSGGVQNYKSGFILMSALSKKPILPVCIIKGKRKLSRIKVVIGEPIDISKTYGDRLTPEQMEEIAKILSEKEKQLLEKYKGEN